MKVWRLDCEELLVEVGDDTGNWTGEDTVNILGSDDGLQTALSYRERLIGRRYADYVVRDVRITRVEAICEVEESVLAAAEQK